MKQYVFNENYYLKLQKKHNFLLFSSLENVSTYLISIILIHLVIQKIETRCCTNSLD